MSFEKAQAKTPTSSGKADKIGSLGGNESAANHPCTDGMEEPRSYPCQPKRQSELHAWRRAQNALLTRTRTKTPDQEFSGRTIRTLNLFRFGAGQAVFCSDYGQKLM